jgi:hypothetical protein
MSETVTVTKEQLRRALVSAWTDCMPAAHLDLDETWRILKNGEEVPDDVKAGGLYALDTWESWGK